jgi:hypothetical protein
MTMDPYELAASQLLDGIGRPLAMDLRAWLRKQLEALDRYAPATTQTDRKVVVGIKDGRLLVFQAHAEGVDTVDWGAIRGAQVTTHRKAVHGGVLDTAYALTYPKLGALVIDLTYMDSEQRQGLLEDLQRFTASGLADA